MRKLRVVVLLHEDLVPPERITKESDQEIHKWKAEYDVIATLREMGHHVEVLGISDSLLPIRALMERWKPHIVFNLLAEFQDIGAYEAHVVAYLELLNVSYTGCNSRGLLIARDKALAKKIMRFHRIPTPPFMVVRAGRRPRLPSRLNFPLIVKSSEEDASWGVSQASIVKDLDHLVERAEFIHRTVGTNALVEEYIEGREITCAVLGNQRLTTFPVWEMKFGKLPEGSAPIATDRVKWSIKQQDRWGITTKAATGLSEETTDRIAQVSRRVYRALELSGYGRIDFRLDVEGRLFVIEANPNPDISEDEDFALSAEAAGIEFPDLLRRILRLGLRYHPPWKRQPKSR